MKITINKIHLINNHKIYDILINGFLEQQVNIINAPDSLKEKDVVEVSNVTSWGSCNVVKTFRFEMI